MICEVMTHYSLIVSSQNSGLVKKKEVIYRILLLLLYTEVNKNYIPVYIVGEIIYIKIKHGALCV